MKISEIRGQKILLFFEEFEVVFRDFCYDISDAGGFDFYEHDTVGFVVLYLTCDTNKRSVYDTYLSARFGMSIVLLPMLTLVVWVVTCLGLDEVLHILIGHREDDGLLVSVTLCLRHKLQ